MPGGYSELLERRKPVLNSVQLVLENMNYDNVLLIIDVLIEEMPQCPHKCNNPGFRDCIESSISFDDSCKPCRIEMTMMQLKDQVSSDG